MDKEDIIKSLVEAETPYSWFEEHASDDQFVRAVRACAVPIRFNKELALHILQSPVLGLNGKSQQIFAKIVCLPFIHSQPDSNYKYAPPARKYFDEQLRNNGFGYRDLNHIIADYMAEERQKLLNEGVKKHLHIVRELALREAYHTIPANGKEGLDKLLNFVEIDTREGNRPADTQVAINICEHQAPYLPPGGQVDLWYLKGRYHYLLRHFADALSFLKKVSDSGLHTKSVAISDHFLGVIYSASKYRNYPKAIKVLEESVKLNRELGYIAYTAHPLHTLGTVYNKLGAYNKDPNLFKKAIEVLKESIKLRRKLGDNDKIQLAIALHDLGIAYRGYNLPNKAIRALEQSVKLGREAEDEKHLALALRTLGTVYYTDRQFVESEQALLESLEINEKLGNNQDLLKVRRSLKKLHNCTNK